MSPWQRRPRSARGSCASVRVTISALASRAPNPARPASDHAAAEPRRPSCRAGCDRSAAPPNPANPSNPLLPNPSRSIILLLSLCARIDTQSRAATSPDPPCAGHRTHDFLAELFEKHVINRRVLLSTNQRNDANAVPAIQRFNSRDDDLRFPNINFVARSAAVRYIDVNKRRIEPLLRRRHAKRDERFGIKLHRKSDDWFDTSKTWAAWTRGTGDRCGSNQRIVTPHGSVPTATSAIFTPRSTSMTDTDPERPHAT
jgi:hypothetical protein